MFATSALRIANAIAGVELQERGALSRTLDSIVFPWSVREQQDEPRVRPALAVLFRIAVGPNADYYAHRFVKYERTGRSAPSWHWPAFALPTLTALLASRHIVVGVVTQPDRPRGRGHQLSPSPVKALALSRNIPVLQPEKMRLVALS